MFTALGFLRRGQKRAESSADFDIHESETRARVHQRVRTVPTQFGGIFIERIKNDNGILVLSSPFCLFHS